MYTLDLPGAAHPLGEPRQLPTRALPKSHSIPLHCMDSPAGGGGGGRRWVECGADCKFLPRFQLLAASQPKAALGTARALCSVVSYRKCCTLPIKSQSESKLSVLSIVTQVCHLGYGFNPEAKGSHFHLSILFC